MIFFASRWTSAAPFSHNSIEMEFQSHYECGQVPEFDLSPVPMSHSVTHYSYLNESLSFLVFWCVRIGTVEVSELIKIQLTNWKSWFAN